MVSFTPDGGQSVLSPVLAGASFASQNSLEMHFGLGSADQGTVEVVWTGGTRNRLYEVERGERLILPEIPCGFDREWPNEATYQTCVETALNQLVRSGVITSNERRDRFLVSAIRAFRDHRTMPPVETLRRELDTL